MVVVPDLVGVVGVEGLVADVAGGLIEVFVGEPIVPLETILVVGDGHHLRLEAPKLTNQPLHAILPHPGPIPNIELGEV